MRRVLAALLVLATSGCAAIPTQTSPIPVNPSAGGATQAAAPEPTDDLDPLNLVRGFVNASVNPDGDYAAAKAYLTPDAQKAWDTKAPPTIIETTFNTVPGEVETGQDPKKRAVSFNGKYVGRLETGDSSFQQQLGDFTVPVGVTRDDNGHWRISEPPVGIYMPLNGFNLNYRRVTLYFYSPDFSVLVPDPRYVVVPPSTSIPRRVTELLLKGPAANMRGALATAIPNGATQRKDTHEADDGALEVDLAKVGDLTAQVRKQVVAQVVKSLAGVTSSRIKVLVEGAPISPDQTEWRPADVQTGESLVTPDADLSGLLVKDSSVRQLADGVPVKGPAGTAEYGVLSAAQSLDGAKLALVCRDGDRARLRVGGTEDDSLPFVDLPAVTMTRPSWLLSGRAGEPSTEVWTVVDGTKVVRVSKTDTGWSASAVNATDLEKFGTITELRLSRDGTRVAVVAGGTLVVAAVVRGQDSTVALRAGRSLQPSALATGTTTVDWLAQDVLVVGTSSPSYPVLKVNLDGLKVERYNTSNLTVPIISVAAAPGRNVVAVDQSGIWSAGDIGDVWRSSAVIADRSTSAFYPG
ncbi:LpqB family beta-propeller domain-containing protein [Actinosynnema sp. NPDC020468]|uniref:LpqB family beta-propeller domain-containing protein n=1 Tax=Actinosynnema sp. NPDC020468 TaxID=3154488 RepID=UPI00340082BF